MELTLSILVFLSVQGCTLSAPPAAFVALASTPAPTLTLQPPDENNLPLIAAVHNSTPATINNSLSAAEKEPPGVAFVIPAELQTNHREKKSTLSDYGIPGQYQGLPISGALGLPSQGIGVLPYNQFGEGFPVGYYKTSDSTAMQGIEDVNTSQKDIQAELARQQEEIRMRDAAALEEANMSLFRSGGRLSLPPVPVIDNFLPTIPLSNGQQLRGVFPNVPGGGGSLIGGGRCGAIPLLVSCSPRLVSGSLVGANGYGSGVYGSSGTYGGNGVSYYGGGYQLTPWFNGIFGGDYRHENGGPATPSPIPINNAGAKKTEKPDQNYSKGSKGKKTELVTAAPKDSTGGDW